MVEKGYFKVEISKFKRKKCIIYIYIYVCVNVCVICMRIYVCKFKVNSHPFIFGSDAMRKSKKDLGLDLNRFIGLFY